ncbi:hypothetical protein R3P38DRAFT_3193241 [Favolaschia claudopus]|uniref:Ubiquitin-like protease family profile domain-containing protein n=1 Tax=Favolaschia claudopus TaxID=2862362 RepID=A0AAW0BH35_9AGAR
MDGYGDLTLDELEMNTAQVTRWEQTNWLLRAKEMEMFALMLNYSEVAQRDGWLFLSCAPTCFPLATLNGLNWSLPLTPENLHAQKLSVLAEIFEYRKEVRVHHLVCFHLSGGHWTIFCHDLDTDGPGRRVRRLNSLARPRDIELTALEKDLGFSIEDQVLLSFYLHPYRFANEDEEFCHTRPKITTEMKILEEEHFALQLSDSETCGFWAVFIVLPILLKFDPKQTLAKDMNLKPIKLKGLLAPMYQAFRANPTGVPLDLVQQLFAKFKPALDYGSLKESWFSQRPAYIAPAEAEVSNDDSAEMMTRRICDPSIADSFWILGDERVEVVELRALHDDKALRADLFDAALRLSVHDVEASSPGVDYYVADSSVAMALQDLKKNKGDNDIVGTAPKLWNTRQLWFEDQDIFTVQWLIIPWLWKPQDHWLLVAVNMNDKKIYVYDSAMKGSRRGKSVTERTFQMLRWEHQTRYQTDLAEGWKDEPNLLAVPQHEAVLDRGLCVLWFARQLMCGNADTTKWVWSEAECKAERDVLLRRLASAIHADMQEHNVTQLARMGFVASDPEDKKDALRRDVTQGMYPLLPSTIIQNTQSLADWRRVREERLTGVSVGTCVLVYPLINPPAPAGTTKQVYPALVEKIIDSYVEFSWFEGIYDALPMGFDVRNHWRMSTESVKERWLAMVQRKVSWEQFCRIQWPSHLTNGPSVCPSPLFPHEAGLAEALSACVPEITAIFCSAKPEHADGASVFTTLDYRFVRSADPERFYRNYLGAGRGYEPFYPADEAFSTTVCDQIQEQVPFFSDDGQVLRPRNELRGWIAGAGRCMLATVAAAYYLDVDLAIAAELLEKRRVSRLVGTHERVLATYVDALEEYSLGMMRQIMDKVIVVTPGIEVPLPQIVP